MKFITKAFQEIFASEENAWAKLWLLGAETMPTSCLKASLGNLWGQCKPPGSTLQAAKVRTSPIFRLVLPEASKCRYGLHIMP
jgi:hypothetical protein